MRKNQGMTLIELIVVIGVMAIIAGAIAPMTVQFLESEREKVTEDNLDRISDAVRDYFTDNDRFPQNLQELSRNTRGLGTWKGPYLLPKYQTTEVTDNGILYDKWRQAFRLEPQNVTYLRIRSYGQDRRANTRDDIVKYILTSDIWRKKTLNEMSAINSALDAYRLVYQERPVHGRTWPNLLTACGHDWRSAAYLLQQAKLLPPGNKYYTDSWKKPYNFDGAQVWSNFR